MLWIVTPSVVTIGARREGVILKLHDVIILLISLWKMLRDILPTQERMHRMKLPGVPSAVCTLCKEKEGDTSEHALLTGSYIRTEAKTLKIFAVS